MHTFYAYFITKTFVTFRSTTQREIPEFTFDMSRELWENMGAPIRIEINHV